LRTYSRSAAARSAGRVCAEHALSVNVMEPTHARTRIAPAHPGTFAGRPAAHGKFLSASGEKVYVRGVTYGTFRPSADRFDFPDPEAVERDFAQMAGAGANAVRTYTVPPRWLLDVAHRHGLYVMVGIPWEQHVAFLEDRARRRSIEVRVREGVRACAGHPAVLLYAVGNEIPGAIVRWHGRRAVERFVERLLAAAKDEDPDGLITYVNYPTTEYLALPSVDVVAFNVFLEAEDRFDAYLARLHTLAGDRPLVLTEIGFDSRRHGEKAQAAAVAGQVETAFAGGAAGVFVFSWTDEWHRGGFDVEDWEFGVTDRARRPKPALASVSRAFAKVPFAREHAWPRVSVVVCTHNGARTLPTCLEALMRLDYPDFEVVVVDDGSADATAAVAAEYDVRLIRTPNEGLSSARNTGLAAATGEIVAYLDDDASPDPHWLQYLVATLDRSSHVGVGGPNIPPDVEGTVASAIALAPGGPIHVLMTDREAEHLPGCNVAFRKAALEAIGGFDPKFRVAGDDVDVCWRLQERGWTLGFSPAAVVWHRRRESMRAYWRQQRAYGKAEALLERKWPEKYNAAGHVSWSGRVYGGGIADALRLRAGRIYHGVWGSAPFQSLYQPADGLLASLPLMPEWYLAVGAVAAVGALGFVWVPLFAAFPLVALAALAAAVPAIRAAAASARVARGERRPRGHLVLAALITGLHLLQPLARLTGRVRFGLAPWRMRWSGWPVLPRPRSRAVWSERWRPPAAWLLTLEARLKSYGLAVRRGGDFDTWDLEARSGSLGGVRIRAATEEHGAGRQLTRYRTCPRVLVPGVVLAIVPALVAIAAALDGALAVAGVFAGVAAAVAGAVVAQSGAATASVLRACSHLEAETHEAASASEREIHALPPRLAAAERK
jgi:GT2 family glycosyltransferase